MSAPSAAQFNPTFKLESIPKLDRTHFISSFVETQKRHAKYYAEEGRALWNNLDNTQNLNTKSPPQEWNAGFSTPVLIPRKPKSSIRKELISNNPNITHVKTPPMKATSKAKNSSQGEFRLKPSERPKNVPHTKKRCKKSDDDDETVARLKERRERKRAKREIMRPRPAINDNGDNQEDDNNKQSATKEKKARKQKKVPSENAPGLALMHGFTATNVGKHRLTVPPPALGVFSRGKASTKTCTKPSKAARPPVFVESAFLKGTGTGRHAKLFPKELPSYGSPSPGKVPTSPSTPPKTINQEAQNFIAEARSSDISTSSSSDEGNVKSPKAESEVWDIEREGFKLPSNITSLSPERNRSVVLNTRGLPWALKTETMTMDRKADSMVHEEDIASQFGSSLAPSQSASQHGLAGCTTDQVPLLSKYFMPQKPHLASAARTIDETAMLFSAPSTPPLQARTLVHTRHDSASGAFVDTSVAPNFKAHSLYPSHIADEDMCYTLNECYVAPLNTDRRLWEPVSFSDPVNSSCADTTQPLGSETKPHNLASVSYPYDFYIPPRVDAPPLQNNYEYEDDALDTNSLAVVDTLDCGCIGWAPQGYEEGFADTDYYYDVSDYLSQSRYCDAEHAHTAEQDYWQPEFPDDFCEGNSEMASFGMCDEEVDVPLSAVDEWIEPLDRACATSEVDGGVTEVEFQEMPCFLQGREILLGLATSKKAAIARGKGHVTVAEADVARSLKGHWLPQRL